MRGHSCAIGLLAVLVFLLPGSGRAADTPYAGTWKVIFAPGANEMTWFIIQVEDKDSGPKLELVATHADYREFKLQAHMFAKGALRITADGPGGPFKFAIYPPRGDKEPQKMLGSVGFRGLRSFVRLERTEDKTIDSTQRFKSAPGGPELTKAAHFRDDKERAAALKEVGQKYPGSPVAYAAALELAYLQETTGATEDEVKQSTEKAIGIAADYGPEMQAEAMSKIVQMLLRSKKRPGLAVSYAGQMVKGLDSDAPPGEQIAVLKPLQVALRQANRKDKLKEVSERVEKLERLLDEEYLKNAVPFKVEPCTRPGPAGRVVLVELFTGIDCFPCIAADIAFDAALKAYQSRDVILLQYIGPLGNADTGQRAGYYSVNATPTTHVSGGANLGLGNTNKAAGQDKFKRLAKAIQEKLASEASAKIRLKAKQTGDDLVVSVTVSDLEIPSADTKLRLALIEEAVRFPGPNRQRIHHHVVRAMPGGANGFVLKDGTAKQEIKIELADLRRTLADDPVDLKQLAVVAFIQNDKTREVLQATQADVHIEK
jgi:hypothetical protein